MIYALAALGCILAGIVGATLSLKAHGGGSALWPFVGGQVSLVVWAWMTKQPIKPWLAAALFDGVYTVAWFVTLACRGSDVSGRQVLGAALVVAGILLTGSD